MSEIGWDRVDWHESGHLLLSKSDCLSAPVGERDVGHLVRNLARHHSQWEITSRFVKILGGKVKEKSQGRICGDFWGKSSKSKVNGRSQRNYESFLKVLPNPDVNIITCIAFYVKIFAKCSKSISDALWRWTRTPWLYFQLLAFYIFVAIFVKNKKNHHNILNAVSVLWSWRLGAMVRLAAYITCSSKMS